MLIIYYTSHDGKDDFGGILAIFPLIIFILLGVPSTILWMVHIVKVINKEVLKVDTVALILALVVIGLSLVYLPLTQWIG